MSSQPARNSGFKLAFLGDEEAMERDLPQVMGVIARAARAAKASLAKFGLGEIEIWPPGKYPLMGVECASLAVAALAAVEPEELRRCPIVRKIIDNAIAYHAHLHWVQQARQEHARKLEARVQVWKERAA